MAKQIRKSQLLVADLPKLEITVHYFVFVSSLLYILYCAYVESESKFQKLCKTVTKRTSFREKWPTQAFGGRMVVLG